MRITRWLLGGWTAVLLVAVSAAAGPSAAPAATGGVPAEQLTTMFQRYGTSSGSWLGADRTASVPLPDGRTLWLFSDTFLGKPGPGNSRPRSAPLIHNSAILQTGDELGPTVHGGSPSRPSSLVPAESDDEFHWIGDASVSDGSVQVLVNRYRVTGEGPLDHALTGNALASFDLPGLVPEGITALPLGEKVSWGSEVLTAPDGHTYVYGTEAAGEMKFAHVARVRGTDLAQPWEFWTGTAWSPDAGASGRVLSGVGTTYGVRRVDDRYVLVTHENNFLFSADFVAYTADSPAGPFDGPHYLFRAPQADAGHIVYDADLHQDLARPGRLLVSYNVNSLDEAVAYADADIYRPRFFEAAWPPDDTRGRPGPPDALTAVAKGAGSADLAWQPADGDDPTYQVYRRDVTAGQTHFVRLPGAGPGRARTFQSAFLINGHTYEFGVTAVGGRGESKMSNVATMTATVPPPSPPADVRVETDTTGKVTLHWAEVPWVQLFKVFYRDVTDRQSKSTPAGAFPGRSATVGPLRHGHVYEFSVVAVGGGGDSRPSAGVRATITVAPPAAPAAPVAEQRPDGSFQLSWPQVAPGLSYLVRQRDLTAGQSGYGQPGVAKSTTFRTGKLEHGHEYEFSVVAVNDGGQGPPSPAIRAVARLQPPGAAPTELRAEPKPGAVRLTWKSSGTWHWIFRRDLTAGERDFVRDKVPAEGKQATVADLADGHEYEFQVATFNPGGVGPPSAPVKVRLADALPAGLEVSSTGPGNARLTWRETRPGLLYQVQLRDVTAGEAWRTDPYPVQGNRYDAVLLVAGHRYEFRVVVPGGATTAPVGLTAR